MTIEGLWEYVTKKHSRALEIIPQKSFSGYRVAIDAFNLFHKIRAVVRKRIIWSRDVIASPLDEKEIDLPWLCDLLISLMDFISNGITPILVYDGPHTPEKENAIRERSERKASLKQRLDSIVTKDILSIDNGRLNEVRGIMCQLNTLPEASIELAWTFFSRLGIPSVKSNGDGERLCSALCREGVAVAVYSSDGDNLAHGCPIIIRGKSYEVYKGTNGLPTYEIVRLTNILEEFKLSMSEFTDLCIMSKCDYNTNMYNVGIGRSHKLLLTHKTIENVALSNSKYDISCLNHLRCRELFSQVSSRELTLEGFHDPKFDLISLRSLLTEYRIDKHYERVSRLLAYHPSPRDFRHGLSPVLYDCGDVTFVIEDDECDTLNDIQQLDIEKKKETQTVKKKYGSSRSNTRGSGAAASQHSSERPTAKPGDTLTFSFGTFTLPGSTSSSSSNAASSIAYFD